MALVRKMQQGDKTPTLYTFYNKQYDFDDLQREADLGLNDYLGTLRRGSRDEIEFRKAYQDIMQGIKDGTITFSNGRYVDSTGRRSNSPGKNKSKDHYGLMASYIYSKQGRSKEYTKPSTNPKWEGASSAGKWLMNELFGSGTPNLEYFIEQDPYNEETKTRGLDRRSALIINAMKKLHNGLYTDNNIQFEGLSDQDKASYKAILESAINSAETNGIGKDDYLSFTKAFGDLGYNKWFSTDSAQARQAQLGQDQGGQKTQREQFAEWARNTYPLPSRALNTFQITTGQESNGRYLPYTSQQNNEITQTIRGLNDKALSGVFGHLLYTQGYSFNELLKKYTQADYKLSNSSALGYILNEMRQRNMWKQNGEDYFYKIPTIKGLSLKWNGNSLQEISDWDNPFQTETMINEYNSSLGGDYSPYFAIYDRLASYKQGGVIKAQTGIKLSNNANWYSGVFAPQLSHILEGLDANKDYYTWLNDMQDRHSELYRAAGDNFYNKAYKDANVGTYQDLYKQGYGDEWNGNPAGYNSLGIQNAQTQGMFDVFGPTRRTSGDWVGEGNGWKTDNLYSAITDYRRLLGRKGDYTDEQLAKAVEDFKSKGYEFFEDNNGYYKLRPIETPEPVQVEEEPAPEPVPTPTPDTDSNIYPETEKKKKGTPKWLSTLGQASYDALPDIVGAGRLFASLRTNNRVAEVIRKSLNPVLEDTYERYSPVTGAFSEMQFRNRQAAGVRRTASNPFTSDASLQLAGQLDANRQATDLEYQGFLADDREILRTRQEALARQEDNTARRSAVANKNRLSINTTNREIAQLEATRLRQNWQSVDNFLQGIEGRMRNRWDINRQRRDQAQENQISWDYQDEIAKIDADWEAANPGGTNQDKLKDPEYVRRVREAQRARDTSLVNIRYAKRGGSLKPSTVYLINKVIKNESST